MLSLLKFIIYASHDGHEEDERNQALVKILERTEGEPQAQNREKYNKPRAMERVHQTSFTLGRI